MPFTKEERKELTAIKGIGDTFVTRLEQMGLDTMENWPMLLQNTFYLQEQNLREVLAIKIVLKLVKLQKKLFIMQKKN